MAGWLCTDDCNILHIHARPYWIPLLEKNIIVPSNFIEEELEVILFSLLKKLFYYETKFQVLATAMIKSGNGLYPIDYYISGTISRSLSLIYGFETLIRSKNFMSAAHLVRPHLDNYLRLSALWLVDNPNEIASQVWSGTALNTLKDRHQKKMSDSYLRDQAAETYPWIKDVYNETSGFIHFSQKHIASTTTTGKDEMTLYTYVGKMDFDVTNLSRIEATAGMIEICNCICNAVFGWMDGKRVEKMSAADQQPG